MESIWYARGRAPYARERIAPTGSTVGIVVLGDALLQTPDNGAGTTLRSDRGVLLGPHDRPVVNEPLGETFAVGIVTTPVGCEAVFGVAPSTLRGRAVDLLETVPETRGLRERLAGSRSPERLLYETEEWLAARCDGSIAGLDRCERAVALIEGGPSRPIAEIASEVGLSHSQLDRDFTRIVGLSPRVLARLLRVRRLLQGIDVTGRVGWTELAADLGWFDQAHLIRDFKRHTGVTPSQYLAAQRTTFSEAEAADAPGFVPDA